MNPQAEISPRQPVSRDLVKRLAMMAGDLDFHKAAFSDAIDQAALREVVDMLHAVALAHDAAGGYGVYADEEDEDAPTLAGWSWHMDLDIAEFNAGSEGGSAHRTEERT